VATLDTLQEALEETTAVAADFQVPESRVRLAEERLCLARPEGFLVGVMQRTILDVAAQHHAECDRPMCRTCDTIRHGLTTALAALRLAIAAERRAVERGAVERRAVEPLLIRRAS
jgi:hypothetical protein